MGWMELTVLTVIKFDMGIELVCVLGGYLGMRQGLADVCPLPVTCTVDFVDLFVVRHVCLDQNIPCVAWIRQGLLHTCIVVDAEEYVSILSHLTGLKLK